MSLDNKKLNEMKRNNNLPLWIIVVLLYVAQIAEHTERMTSKQKEKFSFETLHDISMITYDAGYFDGRLSQRNSVTGFDIQAYKRDSLQVDSIVTNYFKK